MGFENAIGFPLQLFRRKPKVVLPNILNWIPQTLFILLFLYGITDITSWFSVEKFRELFSNPNFIWTTLNALLPYILIVIPIIIISIIILIFLQCVYIEIPKQAYRKENILLTKAFSDSKSRVLALLWTYFLESLIYIGVFFACIGIGILGGIIGIILGLVFGVLLILLLTIFFWETPAVVIVERISGIRAIKRSYRIARNNFWSLVGVMLIVVICITIINAAVNAIPFIGSILSPVIGLFTLAWISMTPGAFYFEYVQK